MFYDEILKRFGVFKVRQAAREDLNNFDFSIYYTSTRDYNKILVAVG